MAKKETGMSVTLRPWHFWLATAVAATFVAAYIRTTAWILTQTWLAVCVIAVTSIGLVALAAFVYRIVVRLLAQASADHMTLDVKERQHKMAYGPGQGGIPGRGEEL